MMRHPPSPDYISELALIEMSKLQRRAGVLLGAGIGAAEAAYEHAAEISRRESVNDNLEVA